MRSLFLLLAVPVAIVAHYIGILYAGARSGFLAGIDRFEELGDKDT